MAPKWRTCKLKPVGEAKKVVVEDLAASCHMQKLSIAVARLINTHHGQYLSMCSKPIPGYRCLVALVQEEWFRSLSIAIYSLRDHTRG
jgi:hypothetical protein